MQSENNDAHSGFGSPNWKEFQTNFPDVFSVRKKSTSLFYEFDLNCSIEDLKNFLKDQNQISQEQRITGKMIMPQTRRTTSPTIRSKTDKCYSIATAPLCVKACIGRSDACCRLLYLAYLLNYYSAIKLHSRTRYRFKPLLHDCLFLFIIYSRIGLLY